MSRRFIALGTVAVAFILTGVWAFKNHQNHTPSMSHNAGHSQGELPTQGGQATFAALIEIVGLLEEDAGTDWGAVDINGLRDHLLDMHHLMIDTNATQTVIDDRTIRFDIQGSPVSLRSIQRMVPAHAAFIEQSRGWAFVIESKDYGATLTISVEDTEALDKLTALGFYGFMSLDSHHQAHHYQMALGHSSH